MPMVLTLDPIKSIAECITENPGEKLSYVRLMSGYTFSEFDAYKAIPYYVSNSASFRTTYIEDLVIAVIFGIFGGLSNFGLYRKFTANNKVVKVGVKNA